MRIIGGKFKGRRFKAPPNIKARPTTDFAKEGLFNLLINRVDLEDAEVLDLFAGTGSISFEFASRGAKRVIAVDKDNTSFSSIKRNSSDMGIDTVHCLKMDALRYLKDRNDQFDIVFADPPYQLEVHENVHQFIMERDFLKPGGLFILEHSEYASFEKLDGFVEQRKYGHVNFSFYKRPEA